MKYIGVWDGLDLEFVDTEKLVYGDLNVILRGPMELISIPELEAKGIVCIGNAESKLRNLRLTAYLMNKSGTILDHIHGKLVFTTIEDYDFAPMSQEKVNELKEYFDTLPFYDDTTLCIFI